MLAGKKLTDFTNFFSLHNFKKNDDIILNYIETIDRTNLTEQTKIRLDEISKIENEEINQRKLCSIKLSKYAPAFDYVDKVLTVLSATSGGVSIISFTSVVGAPVGIAEHVLLYYFL